MAETKSEQEKEKEAAEQMYQDRLDTIRNLMDFSGAVFLKGTENPYGAKGVQAGNLGYANFLVSDVADKIRKNGFLSKMEKFLANGNTISMPEYSNNNETEEIADALNKDAINRIKFGDLEKLITEKDSECKLEVPEQFKEVIIQNIYDKMNEAKNEGKKYTLTQEEEGAMKTYKLIMKAYREVAMYSLIQKTHMNYINAESEALNEEYKPEEKGTE